MTGASSAVTRYTPMTEAASTAGRCRRKRRIGRGSPRRTRACLSQAGLAAGARAIMRTSSGRYGARRALAVAHARIDDRVADVDQRVDDDVAARNEQHRGLQHRIVAAKDRVDGVLAEAGYREDLLDDQRAAEQLAGLGTDQRQHRDEGVLQRVPRKDGAVA